MKINYQFSNLLGCSYKKGNVCFGHHGNKLYSPVGNKVAIFDLKNNRMETLPCECEYNIVCLCLSPCNSMLIIIDETGKSCFINIISKNTTHIHDFRKKVSHVSFSPDAKRFAVTIGNSVILFKTPAYQPEVNPFIVDKRFSFMHDDITSVQWSYDSNCLLLGSKDQSCYIIGCHVFSNLDNVSLCGLKSSVVNCFFGFQSLDIIGVSQLGEVRVWKCDTKPWQLRKGKRKDILNNNNFDMGEGEDSDDEEKEEKIKNNSKKMKIEKKKEEEEEEDEEKEEEDEEKEEEEERKEKNEIKKEKKLQNKRNYIKQVQYRRIGKYSYKQLLSNDNQSKEKKKSNLVILTAADYHEKLKILVSAFQNGCFYLHEMPNFSLIHSLNMSDQPIRTIKFDLKGDWLAIGCSNLGQLLVWEWQSECYILKQQGHFSFTNCLDYSPDGRYLVSGGEDSKVKIWDTSSGSCIVTFYQHNSSITGVKFKSTLPHVILSSSLDGTVRAFDLIRYRNFRTLTAPDRTSTQFSCVAMATDGDLVAAGGQDCFLVFLWSLKTASLINVLAGHEGPVCCLSFSNLDNMLVSGSWDHTIRLWSLFSKEGPREVIQLTCDALSLDFKPDGKEISVTTLDGNISFYDVITCQQTGSIEGRLDMGYFRKEGDKITAKKASLGKAFRTISYSADGSLVLVGGEGNYICLYSVQDQLIIKRFKITQNKSLQGTMEFLDRRKMTEWGSLSLVDGDEDDDLENRKKISLPGVKVGEFSSRSFKPEVRVNCVKFSPTGLSWAAASSEGILIYSLSTGSDFIFDPFSLDLKVTPQRIMKMLSKGKFLESLILALRLNSTSVTRKVLLSIPIYKKKLQINNKENEDEEDDEEENEDSDEEICEKEKMEIKMEKTNIDQSKSVSLLTYICSSLPQNYVEKLSQFVANQLEVSIHLEFYLIWASQLLTINTLKMKQNPSLVAISNLRQLEKAAWKAGKVIDLMETNRYSLEVLISQKKFIKKNEQENKNQTTKDEENLKMISFEED